MTITTRETRAHSRGGPAKHAGARAHPRHHQAPRSSTRHCVVPTVHTCRHSTVGDDTTPGTFAVLPSNHPTRWRRRTTGLRYEETRHQVGLLSSLSSSSFVSAYFCLLILCLLILWFLIMCLLSSDSSLFLLGLLSCLWCR